MLSFFSFLYTSKDIPSILSYPFCIYETKSHITVQSNPRPNVTTEAAQPYSFHFIFQVILLHLHSSFGYKIHIYATRDTMYKSKERTFVHSSRTRWFTTGLREFRASRKFPGSFPKRRFGVCADPPVSWVLPIHAALDLFIVHSWLWRIISKSSSFSGSCPTIQDLWYAQVGQHDENCISTHINSTVLIY